jgi:hypothetical protein
MNNAAQRLRLWAGTGDLDMRPPPLRRATQRLNGPRQLALAYFRHDVKYLGEHVGVGMALALEVEPQRQTPSADDGQPILHRTTIIAGERNKNQFSLVA